MRATLNTGCQYLRLRMNEKKDLEEKLDKDKNYAPLELIIRCSECGAIYELNAESVDWAALMGTNIIEYISFVQTGDCDACGATPIKSDE